MSIKVIGVGFPRTGTTTLKSALQMIGFNETYHFKDLIANPDGLKYWEELENKGHTNFEELFQGYSATVDFPGYPYYKILLKQYPDAKIILTKRDFEGWYKSTYETIWKAGPQTPFTKLLFAIKMLANSRFRKTINCIKFMRKVHLVNKFDNNFESKPHAKKVYLNHLEEVSQYVPKAQLLIYEVADGWEPLCEFLSVDIPEVPFPHLNKKEHFHEMVKGMIKEASKS